MNCKLTTIIISFVMLIFLLIILCKRDTKSEPFGINPVNDALGIADSFGRLTHANQSEQERHVWGTSEGEIALGSTIESLSNTQSILNYRHTDSPPEYTHIPIPVEDKKYWKDLLLGQQLQVIVGNNTLVSRVNHRRIPVNYIPDDKLWDKIMEWRRENWDIHNASDNGVKSFKVRNWTPDGRGATASLYNTVNFNSSQLSPFLAPLGGKCSPPGFGHPPRDFHNCRPFDFDVGFGSWTYDNGGKLDPGTERHETGNCNLALKGSADHCENFSQRRLARLACESENYRNEDGTCGSSPYKRDCSNEWRYKDYPSAEQCQGYGWGWM
jgi:hypothetical protein